VHLRITNLHPLGTLLWPNDVGFHPCDGELGISGSNFNGSSGLIVAQLSSPDTWIRIPVRDTAILRYTSFPKTRIRGYANIYKNKNNKNRDAEINTNDKYIT